MVGKLQLTMLGTTDTGKTCFMLAMHAVGQSGRSLAGFTLRAKDRDENIKLTQEWRRLRTMQGPDRWPLPNTSNFAHHTFEFCYGFTPLVEFQWLDYRGAALTDLSNQARDAAELVQYASHSDGIILCFPGNFLRDTSSLEKDEPSDDLDDSTQDAEVDAMNSLLAMALKAHRERHARPFPVIIAITKCDTCTPFLGAAGRFDADGKARFIKSVQNVFPSPFMEGQNCHVLIAPVSLGKELVTNGDSGRIQPINMDLPIVFMCFAYLQTQINEQRQGIERLREEAEDAKNAGFFRRLFGNDGYQKAMQEMLGAQNALKDPEQTWERLRAILETAVIYLDGRKQELAT